MNPEGKGQTMAAMNQRIRKTTKNTIRPLLNPRNLTLSINFCELCLDYKKLAMRSVHNSSAFYFFNPQFILISGS